MSLIAAAFPEEGEFLVPAELATIHQEAYVWGCGSRFCLTMLSLLKNGVPALVVKITTRVEKDTGQSQEFSKREAFRTWGGMRTETILTDLGGRKVAVQSLGERLPAIIWLPMVG